MVAAAALWSAIAAAGPPYSGRPLDDALRDIGKQGLHLVYSTETVPPSLLVQREPRAGTPLEVLEELLAQHGLEARRVSADTYAVVRADAASARDAAKTPSAASPPLEEIVVAASRFSLSAEYPDAHTFLTQAEIEGMPRLADDSLKAVHRLPGAASNGVSGLAYMRGGVANETLVSLDGFPLYEPFHLKVLLSPTSLLDPSIVDGLDVHAGGYTAEFGDRMSAVIDATSIHPDAEQQYQVGLSLFNASLFAFNRFDDGKGQWLVAARRSNLDEIANLVDASYGELRYSDAFARLDYEFTPDTRGSLHMLASSDKADVTNALKTESAEATYRNSYVWATVEHDFSSAFTASAIASYTYVKSTRQGEVDEEDVRTGVADDRRHYDVLGLKLDATWRADRWLTRFGAELRWLDASYDYSSTVHFEPGYPFPDSGGITRINDLSPAPSGQHYALYATTRVRIADPLTAEFGLRWDDETYTPEGSDQLGPRVNLLYQVAPRTRLRASWGIYQQSQGINELQVEDGVDRFFRPQRATHEILGLEQGLPQGFNLRLEGYIKDYDEPALRFESLYDPTSLVPELRWDRVAIWPGSSRSKGVEVLLTRKSDSPWNGWINYAWSRVYDRRNGKDTLRSWDQTSNLGGGITWSEGGWQATLAATYHTGWPTTPVRLVGTVAGEQTALVGPRNASRLNSYASVDARVSREFTLKRGTLNVFAEVTNLLDRPNHCCTDFDYETEEDGTAVIEREYRNWLPLIPNVGLLWKF
jgi:TonB dependent receptor-like, beta-barrel